MLSFRLLVLEPWFITVQVQTYLDCKYLVDNCNLIVGSIVLVSESRLNGSFVV